MSAPPRNRRRVRPGGAAPQRSDGPATPAVPAATAPRPGSFEERVRSITSVIAPGTVLGALLYYFGYVTTYARYAYFGIDLNQVGLSQQDLLLRSVAALFLPAGALAVLGLLVGSGRRVLLRAAAADRPEARTRRLRRSALAVAALGALVLARGLLGVLVPDVSAREPIATSAGCLAGGALAMATALWFRSRLGGADDPVTTRQLWIVTWVVVALGLFWATNSVAGAYGRGQAVDFVAKLPTAPRLTLDSTERLYLPQVKEFTLPAEPGQRFRYRYRDLRLLVASHDRLFVLPATWQPGRGEVLVVEAGDSVRLQFSR